MATIKEIKRELDERGIEYPTKGLKAEYEILRVIPSEIIKEAQRILDDAGVPKEGRAVFVPGVGFIDPNASEGTQAK